MLRRPSSIRSTPPGGPALPFSRACAFSKTHSRDRARWPRLRPLPAVDAWPSSARTREALHIWVTAIVSALLHHPASYTVARDRGRHHTCRPTGVPTGSALPRQLSGITTRAEGLVVPTA